MDITNSNMSHLYVSPNMVIRGKFHVYEKNTRTVVATLSKHDSPSTSGLVYLRFIDSSMEIDVDSETVPKFYYQHPQELADLLIKMWKEEFDWIIRPNYLNFYGGKKILLGYKH